MTVMVALIGVGVRLAVAATTTSSLALTAVLFGISGISLGPFAGALFTTRRYYAPEELQAQVFTISTGLRLTMAAAGAAISGTLAGLPSATQLIFAASTVLFAGGLGALALAISSKPPLNGLSYRCNLESVTDIAETFSARSWIVVLARLPAEPARHRMALWRELRRSGAIALGLPAVRPLLERVSGLVDTAGGTLLRLAAKGYAAEDVARLEQSYATARKEEWAEFAADCGKYLAELDKEERLGKYTLAELEEEEQSLDRLRRWYRELRSRDLLAVPATTDSATMLKQCEERFEAYADQVYTTLSSTTD
jgi:Protein ChrB, N-terminal